MISVIWLSLIQCPFISMWIKWKNHFFYFAVELHATLVPWRLQVSVPVEAEAVSGGSDNGQQIEWHPAKPVMEATESNLKIQSELSLLQRNNPCFCWLRCLIPSKFSLRVPDVVFQIGTKKYNKKKKHLVSAIFPLSTVVGFWRHCFNPNSWNEHIIRNPDESKGHSSAFELVSGSPDLK